MAGESSSSHPASAEVHAHMDALWELMRCEGYAPDWSCVLHDVDEAQKAAMLQYHSEKLAIPFRLLRAPPGAAIKVAKNLRVCNVRAKVHTFRAFPTTFALPPAMRTQCAP
uniref:DYW domain-containing protein n=1 Tax=Aegilops tauschii TaxID=37682 RepID=N1R1W8_AEGTA